MKTLTYFVGFAALMATGVFVGRLVENIVLALGLALVAGFGLIGLTEQIAQSVDDE